MKETDPTNPYRFVPLLDSSPERILYSSHAAKFLPAVRWVLLFGAIGLAGLLAALLPVGDVAVIFAGFAYCGGLCLASFGFGYSATVWKIPWLESLVLISPMVCVGGLHASILLRPNDLDLFGQILTIAGWVNWSTISWIILRAIAGWFACWHDYKALTDSGKNRSDREMAENLTCLGRESRGSMPL